MIDESIMEKIIPVPDEDEEMEKIQSELIEENFPVTNFKKGGVFYFLTRLMVSILIDLKELARTILNSNFILHAEGDWLEIKAADYSKQRKEAVKTKGYITIYRRDYQDDLRIKKGHGFKTDPNAAGNELKYYAYKDTVIPAGVEVGEVLVEAENAGGGYDVKAKTINTSMVHMDGVEYVTNNDGWITEASSDIETLESLRTRCVSSWAELSTRTVKEKLINAAKSVPGVLYADVDDQHPRGQGTVDIIITGENDGVASDLVLERVEEAIAPLKGNYEDYQLIRSKIAKQDFEIVIYLSSHASTEGVVEQATELIKNLMKITRDDVHSLYRDSIIRTLSNNVLNYRRSDIVKPATDLQYSKEMVVVAGEIKITVLNI